MNQNKGLNNQTEKQQERQRKKNLSCKVLRDLISHITAFVGTNNMHSHIPSIPMLPAPTCPIPLPTGHQGPQAKLMLPGMGWRSCSPTPLCSLCLPGTRLVECSSETLLSQPACPAPVLGQKHLSIISWWPFMGDNPIP